MKKLLLLALIAILALPNVALAAIAYDTDGAQYTPTSASSSVSLAATSANSKAIILTWNGNGSDLSSVTVGGVAATKVRSFNPSGGQWMGIYYFDNPPTSSTAYVANATNAADDVEIAVIIYSGATTGAVDSSAEGTATGNLTLSTTVVATGSWLVSHGRNFSSGVPGAGTNTTSRGPGTAINYGDSNGTVGTGSQSLQWTAGAGTTGGVIVSIAPTADAPVAVNNQDMIVFD